MIQQWIIYLVTIAAMSNASPLNKRADANGVIPKGIKALNVKQGPGSVVCIEKE